MRILENRTVCLEDIFIFSNAKLATRMLSYKIIITLLSFKYMLFIFIP